MTPLVFGRSVNPESTKQYSLVNPIPIRAADYAHHITTIPRPPSSLLDLPPPLNAFTYDVRTQGKSIFAKLFMHSLFLNGEKTKERQKAVIFLENLQKFEFQ